MIAYFVYNLEKYSGAAQQALLLAETTGRSIVIFNHERGVPFSRSKLSDKIEVINLPDQKLRSFVLLVYYLLKLRVSILHLHGFFKHGILLGWLLRKKVIVKTTLMGSDDFLSLEQRNSNNSYFAFLLSKLDVNICLTEQLKRENVQLIDERKITIIPNGVNISATCDIEKENIFCFVGLICERKGTYESIEYFLKNYLHLPGAIMYVIGPLEGVAESDNAYVQRCYDLVASFGAARQVVFTGNLKKKEVAHFLKKSKALLFFSKNEGMPNVVLEAMANNCAPITKGLDGVMEDLLGKELAIKLISEQNRPIKIDVVNEVVRLHLLRDRAINLFSIEIVAFRYNELYEELLS